MLLDSRLRKRHWTFPPLLLKNLDNVPEGFLPRYTKVLGLCFHFMLLRVPSTETTLGCDPSILLLEHGDVPESIGWTVICR